MHSEKRLPFFNKKNYLKYITLRSIRIFPVGHVFEQKNRLRNNPFRNSNTYYDAYLVLQITRFVRAINSSPGHMVLKRTHGYREEGNFGVQSLLKKILKTIL